MTGKPRIDRITLKDLCPNVFCGESLPYSEVWHSELVFERGCRYLVEAASGAGKSSLCSFIYGARKDYKGAIFFNDKNVAGFSINKWQELRRRHLAYLPQELMLFPELSAIDNIRLKNDATGYVSGSRIDSWLELLGLGQRRNFPVGKMSVGQQQRVAIIRALCQPFDFILLDEPVSHLDVENNKIVAHLVEEVASAQGAAIISTSVGNPLLLQDAKTIKL